MDIWGFGCLFSIDDEDNPEKIWKGSNAGILQALDTMGAEARKGTLNFLTCIGGWIPRLPTKSSAFKNINEIFKA